MLLKIKVAGEKPLDDARAKMAKILAEGTRYTAKIIDYSDGAGLLNGIPALDLVVVFDRDGIEQTLIVLTGDCDEAKYPINAYCDIALLGIEGAVIPNTVRF